jgi:hypothetical protein
MTLRTTSGNANMIASYKRKANIAGATFLVALIGPVVLVNVLAWTGHKVLRRARHETEIYAR